MYQDFSWLSIPHFQTFQWGGPCCLDIHLQSLLRTCSSTPTDTRDIKLEKTRPMEGCTPSQYLARAHCGIQAASTASAPKGSHTGSQQLCFEWTCIKSWIAALLTQHQSCRECSAESLRGVSEGARLWGATGGFDREQPAIFPDQERRVSLSHGIIFHPELVGIQFRWGQSRSSLLL